MTAKPLSPQQIAANGPVRWQALWRDAIRDPEELLALLGLPALSARVSGPAAAQFPLRVPRGFAARMRPGDPHDPLLRQVLPLDDEDRMVPGFGLDAVGDRDARGGTGIVHKYDGRALLVATGSCAVHCRYCFRRHFPYGEETAAANHWREALDYLAADPSIHEVLLSGGDPLSLATPKLAEFTDALARLPSVRRLRLHTRLPVVLPERVDAELLGWLAALPQQVGVVIHANHAKEIDAPVAGALAALRRAGATLLNQAVLLRGVNDRTESLAELSERLFEAGVLPYYLHQLDRVAGTAHFEVPDDTARELHAGLAARLPGYLVPRLVREIAGAPAKTPL
ncbi:MAG TPA: EF-P beta-lysylation protein EpmB [Arenimonas sp.]|nr:EF-P beta-lysylation protein EpmB [Arenimonas sp.]